MACGTPLATHPRLARSMACPCPDAPIKMGAEKCLAAADERSMDGTSEMGGRFIDPPLR